MLCTNLPGSHLCCIVASCTGQCDMLIASISHLCCIFSSSFSVALQYKFYANFTCVVFQVKELQKATRVIQALCSEAKVRLVILLDWRASVLCSLIMSFLIFQFSLKARLALFQFSVRQ